jgi:hypothetical protein
MITHFDGRRSLTLHSIFPTMAVPLFLKRGSFLKRRSTNVGSTRSAFDYFLSADVQDPFQLFFVEQDWMYAFVEFSKEISERSTSCQKRKEQ